MARIAVLGLGNWGTAIARLWLQDGHTVNGWTIEDEVYASIMTHDVNEKYLPERSLKGLEVTMRIEDAIDDAEIVVLAVPSAHILDVVEALLPHLRPSHVLLDLAKGLAPGKRLISEAIEGMLEANNMSNALAVLTGHHRSGSSGRRDDHGLGRQFGSVHRHAPGKHPHHANLRASSGQRSRRGRAVGRVQERRRPCLRACGRAQAGRNHRW